MSFKWGNCCLCPNPLRLPPSSLYVCDHCSREMCFSCLRSHHLELTMTYRIIPREITQKNEHAV